jgi:hypothetical protein
MLNSAASIQYAESFSGAKVRVNVETANSYCNLMALPGRLMLKPMPLQFKGKRLTKINLSISKRRITNWYLLIKYIRIREMFRKAVMGKCAAVIPETRQLLSISTMHYDLN